MGALGEFSTKRLFPTLNARQRWVQEYYPQSTACATSFGA